MTLTCSELTVGYGGPDVVKDVNLHLSSGQVTALIGPNGCGKSTLLKTLGRQLTPSAGAVYLSDQNISKYSSRAFAREVSFLPQHPVAPEGVLVRDVIGYGRYPYTGALATMRAGDHAAVERAASRAGVSELLDAPAADLSGGQRQRVFLAMTLAQETPITLLDEPTTYLDPAHQLSILDLVRDLNGAGTTVVMVVHDMVHAARYADRIVAMREGRIVAEGPTEEVMTAELVRETFYVECLEMTDPSAGRRFPIPISVHAPELSGTLEGRR